MFADPNILDGAADGLTIFHDFCTRRDWSNRNLVALINFFGSYYAVYQLLSRRDCSARDGNIVEIRKDDRIH